MEEIGWLRLAMIPLVGAGIGWATNALAIRMIFRPRRPLVVGRWSWQGLVPRRQGELARQIGMTVQEHLINHEDLERVLARPELRRGIERALSERIAHLLDRRAGRIHPLLGTLLRGRLRQRIERLAVREASRLIARLSAQTLERMRAELDFQAIVEAKVRAFDLELLEGIVHGIARRELRAIEWAGAALGGLIGLVQLLVLLI